MSTGNPRSRTVTTLRRRVLRAIAAPAAAIALIAGVMAAPASAFPQACTGASDANACLFIDLLPSGDYLVHVGIDVHMSRQAAQAIIDAPGDPFRVVVVGLNGSAQRPLFPIRETTILASDCCGLTGDFDTLVFPFQLDVNRGSASDQVHARIVLTDSRGSTLYLTPQIDQSF